MTEKVWKGDDYEINMRVIRQSGSDRIEIWKEQIEEELARAIEATIDAYSLKLRKKPL